jgi:hypothetical protein
MPSSSAAASGPSTALLAPPAGIGPRAHPGGDRRARPQAPGDSSPSLAWARLQQVKLIRLDRYLIS